MSHQLNITRIKAVYNALGDIRDDVVFIGGAAVSLYADRAAEEVRETKDVDILVEVYTHQKFAELEEKLRAKGFVNDSSSKFAARYKIKGVIVDVMPVDKKVLGFSNRWYELGFTQSIKYVIDENHQVRIFSAPHFLASKIEAFNNRGRNDGRTSSDFEDIVYLLFYRDSIWNELANTERELKEYITKEFEKLLDNPYLEEWIDVHTGYGSPVGYYSIIPEMKKFIQRD
jgi:predicted nucleotidyltransferase